MHQRKRQPPPPPPPPAPPSRPPSTTGAAVMDAKQLIATLPSYISLYTHRANPSPNTNRTSILKWFASLSPPKRLSHLTIVDHAFTQILLQMASEARNGHMTFILLPDIPSRGPPHLPSLCSRRCQGLLARIADSDEPGQVIRGSIRVFNSKEGEDIRECRCRSDYLDTVSFSEEFVEDVDRFVEVMDRVSDMGFLNGSDWGELGEEWVELGWLKAKGYYSMEAFVVNRVEVALRFAWLNCNNGKKRGVKLKEKASSRVGVGANVYWRKKGCVDWWERLDDEVKRKALRMVLGKGAKSLTGEILSIAAKTGGEEMWPLTRRADRPLRSTYHAPSGRDPQDAEFGLKMTSGSWSLMPTSLACVSNGLFVLQDIVSLVATCQHGELDKEKLFYSSLDSISTLSDCILRKLRGLLMVISLDSTKIELLEEEDLKFSPNKSKEKLAATSRKKKGKNRNTKKSKPTLNNCKDGLAPGVTTQDSGSGLANKEIMDLDVPNENDGTVVGVHGQNRLSSVVEGGTAATLVSEKVQTTNGRNRKHSNKKRNPCGRIAAASEVEKSPAKLPNVSSSCAADQSGEERLSISDHSAACDIKIAKNNSIDTHGTEHIPCQCHLTSKVSNFTDIQPDSVVGSAEGSPQMLPDCRQPLNNMKSNEEVFSKSETVNNMINSGGRPPDVAGTEMQVAHDDEDSNKDPVFPNQRASASVLRETNIDGKNEFVQTAGCENRSVYSGEAVIPPGYPSYEWPTVVPPRFACVNSQQLPPATDRLHLEVGHNWQNRTQQSFLQQIHQMRNSSIEGGCGRVLSQPLPVSLDWPPMVRNVNGFASSLTCNYDSGFISRRQSVLQQSLTAQNAHFSAVNNTQSSGDFFDPELTSTQEIADEYENHWVSEEEYEVHTVPSVDYNQYFGGGIMYWNPSDYPAAGFSRPPSLSSDDSSWAWREADMNRTVDDMVAFSSSYSTNGLASPSAAPFCSPFESLGPGHQPISYVRAGNDASGKILHTSPTVTDLEAEEKLPGVPSDSDAKSGDSLPYPMLRPIIIPNMSRERSRHDLRSPCVRPNRREQPRIKRPPSPVVLCVPRAPRPPPPSPVGDSRKQRGFLTVRSGSSSPRNWGIKGRHSEGSTFDEACVRMDGAEVVWPSWANKTFSGHQVIQPLPGALLQDRLIAISQLTHDQEHPDIALPLQPPELLNCPLRKASLPLMHNLLHKEIDSFCKRVAAENMMRRPHINWAVKRVTRSLQVLWPRSRTNVFGSNATGLSLPTSDVDLVVCLPPVRNLEPIKEAGILEGRNSIKETCLQHAARYLANQEWVKSDSLKTVENTAIPIIMLVVEVPHDLVVSTTSNMQTPESEATQLNNERGTSQTDTAGSDSSPSPKSPEQNNNGKDVKSVRLDISFKSPSHTGLQTTELVKELTEQFPAAIPLALVLKQFLADRSLDQSYSGGLSSYCLVLLITRFLQHEHHHGRSINQNLGSLFMDFLYFFGNVFDPRQMSISIQGSGVYMNRERGYSIDPIYIDDPLFPTNNVGKNCFRIHQCIKAFADAYSTLENELTCIANDGDASVKPQYRLLPKVIPSIGLS